jgi:GAF domain-containing protein
VDDAQTIIARVGATIASTLTIDEVMSAIARQVCEAFGVASADIHRYSAETDLLDYVASWGVAEGFTEEGTGWGSRTRPRCA